MPPRAATAPYARPGTRPSNIYPGASFSYLATNVVNTETGTSYRVTMNSFLATGGDGFTVFNAGTDATGGGQDIGAFVAAFTAAGQTGIPVPPVNRITAA